MEKTLLTIKSNFDINGEKKYIIMDGYGFKSIDIISYILSEMLNIYYNSSNKIIHERNNSVTFSFDMFDVLQLIKKENKHFNFYEYVDQHKNDKFKNNITMNNTKKENDIIFQFDGNTISVKETLNKLKNPK